MTKYANDTLLVKVSAISPKRQVSHETRLLSTVKVILFHGCFLQAQITDVYVDQRVHALSERYIQLIWSPCLLESIEAWYSIPSKWYSIGTQLMKIGK